MSFLQKNFILSHLSCAAAGTSLQDVPSILNFAMANASATAARK